MGLSGSEMANALVSIALASRMLYCAKNNARYEHASPQSLLQYCMIRHTLTKCVAYCLSVDDALDPVHEVST